MSTLPSLLAISIGPVQDFIAAARKTRDLWFGSTMLSEVARAAAIEIDGRGGQLIFPHAGALTNPTPVPNKLLVLVPAGHGDGPQSLAALAKAAATKRLTRYRDEMLQSLPPFAHNRIDLALIDEQVDAFLEFYAAWHPFDASAEDGYRTGRRTVELLLAGRKALRDFAPAHGRDRRRKSSLDPSRESVLLSDEPDLRSTLHLKGREELDGVSLIKRLAERQRFVSTARVAIDPFLRRLGAAGRSADVERLYELAAGLEGAGTERFTTGDGSRLDHYGSFPFDTQLFYDDGEREQTTDDQRQRARAFVTAVERARGAVSVGELPRYYAVVAADGDRMGATISALATPRAHADFSARLSAFAVEAETITQAHHGALVYSGGDDVLAFLPLDTMLCYAAALREAFTRTVNQGGITGLTLSVGVAIVHFGAHLQNALSWARHAEHLAKSPRRDTDPTTARNALAIALHTASGGADATSVVQSWDDDPVVDRWLRWVTWHRRNLIPDGAAFELRALVREFHGLGAVEGGDDVLRREVRRILIRKEPGGAKLHEEEIAAVMARVGTDLDGLDRLVRELIIARRIAQAMDVAHGPWTAIQPVCAGNVTLQRDPEEVRGHAG